MKVIIKEDIVKVYDDVQTLYEIYETLRAHEIPCTLIYGILRSELRVDLSQYFNLPDDEDQQIENHEKMGIVGLILVEYWRIPYGEADDMDDRKNIREKQKKVETTHEIIPVILDGGFGNI